MQKATVTQSTNAYYIMYIQPVTAAAFPFGVGSLATQYWGLISLAQRT